jgi:type II secretory pathway component GspD/PulD (secretin)
MHRTLLAGLFAVSMVAILAAQEKKADSPIVAKTKKKLDTKITVNFNDEKLKDVIDELKKEAEVSFRLDSKGGVSGNMSFTYKAEDKPLKDVLAEMFKGKGLGYVIHRKQNSNDRYEGYIDIVQGDQRGDDKPK